MSNYRAWAIIGLCLLAISCKPKTDTIKTADFFIETGDADIDLLGLPKDKKLHIWTSGQDFHYQLGENKPYFTDKDSTGGIKTNQFDVISGFSCDTLNMDRVFNSPGKTKDSLLALNRHFIQIHNPLTITLPPQLRPQMIYYRFECR